MDDRILTRLAVITPEEQEILSGRENIDKSIYMDSAGDVISGGKLLAEGKLVAVRPHTRFIHFPEHSHDYVEMVYMCRGSTTHVINGTSLQLKEGEILILGQDARQEVMPADIDDIAVNFIIRPEFFSGTLDYLGREDTPLRSFIVRCICGDNPTGYLHFRATDIKPVQNLVENLLWNLIEDAPNRRSIDQMTMGLMFVHLMNHTEMLSVGSKEQETMVRVLRYIEENYLSGSLAQVASMLHYDQAWLSREIKRRTKKNFTQLMQEKRLSQAAWLLQNTDENVSDIAIAVGYENISYFHRLFAAHFGVSPRAFRKQPEAAGANKDTF
ncbi:MAG: helix-turn-helix domain-containing protein [Oscillospiraceae bacterium]|nr:helix-turn-helix domain-containing protein [Oscillospiraceae bacterium]